jgi:hypothetical protein
MSEKQRDTEEGRRLGQKLSEVEKQMKATEGHRIHLKIQALAASAPSSKGSPLLL